jgi:hypothetical protein
MEERCPELEAENAMLRRLIAAQGAQRREAGVSSS